MRPLTDVSAALGAPMGRPDVVSAAAGPIEFEIERMVLVDGDYDEGGAYWGGVEGENIYRAEGTAPDGVDTLFLRARNLAAVKLAILETHPQATFAASAELDSMVAAYREAALWSTTNDRHEDDNDEPENLQGTGFELAEATVQAMRRDCEEFLVANGDLIASAEREYGFGIEKVGYNFLMVRNRSGIGFCDRGMGEVGYQLDAAASEYGEANLYVGDDDLIYQSGQEPTADAAPAP